MSNETMVTLQGNVGGDVTLRQAGEQVVASFRLACTPRRFHRKTGEWVDGETQWYTVNAWRNLGDHCSRSLRRGDPVVVQGRLTQRSYINKNQVEVTALEVEALLVGHDLSRGVSVFTRRPAQQPRTAVASPEEATETAA
jgi:single-strand DNA-binding protein